MAMPGQARTMHTELEAHRQPGQSAARRALAALAAPKRSSCSTANTATAQPGLCLARLEQSACLRAG